MSKCVCLAFSPFFNNDNKILYKIQNLLSLKKYINAIFLLLLFKKKRSEKNVGNKRREGKMGERKEVNEGQTGVHQKKKKKKT